MIKGEDFIKEALEAARNLEFFCECAIIGSDKHLKYMEDLIEKDPKRYQSPLPETMKTYVFHNSNILERHDPDHLLNKKNRFKQNALYLACKNGNLNIVKFLIQQSANPHVESSVIFSYIAK